MHLLGAALMVLIGAFLPWVATGAGNIAGVRGAGIWTMYAAMIGVAGAIIKRRRIAAAHAALLAIPALALPVWQLVHLASLVGFAGWMPGPGLVLTIGGGALALSVALRTLRSPEPAAQPS